MKKTVETIFRVTEDKAQYQIVDLKNQRALYNIKKCDRMEQLPRFYNRKVVRVIDTPVCLRMEVR